MNNDAYRAPRTPSAGARIESRRMLPSVLRSGDSTLRVFSVATVDMRFERCHDAFNLSTADDRGHKLAQPATQLRGGNDNCSVAHPNLILWVSLV